MLLYQVAASKAYPSAGWTGRLWGVVPLTLVRTPGPSVIFLNGDIISQAESVSFRLVGLDSWIFLQSKWNYENWTSLKDGIYVKETLDFSETDTKGWLRKSETLKILPSYIYLIALIMKRKEPYMLIENTIAHNWMAQRQSLLAAGIPPSNPFVFCLIYLFVAYEAIGWNVSER